MSDTFITIIAISIATFLMFVFPVLTMANRVDTLSQVDVETTTSEFINEIKNTGKLRSDHYDEYIQNLTSNRKFI